ncbi:MAG: gliding motility-associated C-terminal domain-containing protein [Saprospiraceae bacterium]
MAKTYSFLSLKNYLLAAFCCLAAFQANAQINPPIFQCVKGDTLFWQPDPNPCGTFNSYLIYFSTTQAGPYSLLATITDPMQLYFVHLGGGPIRYYYMETDLNCPGFVAYQSDTLDNFPPPKTPIEVLSIGTNGIDLQWIPNSSPTIIGYIIYKATASGTIPIDTVYGNSSNSYTDQSSGGDSLNYYYILSLDACGNTSQFDLPHHNILATIQTLSCQRTHHLEWNLYDSWPDGIAKQEVLLSINNGPEAVIATLGAGAISYDNLGLLKNTNYCYRIAAYRNSGNFISYSDTICDNPVIVQGMRNLYLTNVSAIAGNQLELTWQWDATAELSSYELSHNGQSFESVLAPLGTLNVINQIISDLSASDPAQNYLVKTTDLCDSMVSSNTLKNAVLSGISQSNGNSLTWTPFFISTGTVLSYELFNDLGGLIATLPADSLSYFDLIPSGSLLKSCYVLRVNFSHELGSLQDQTFTSVTNTYCVEPQAALSFPNAFTPQGDNPIFRPVVTFQNVVQDYSLQIFDRWGGLVFQSEAIGQGWDGMNGGNIMPAGMYVYYARLQQSNGRQVEKTGHLLLIK